MTVRYADDGPIVHHRGYPDRCVLCMVLDAEGVAVGEGGGWALCEPHLEAFDKLGLAVVNNAARVSTLHSIVARLWYAPPYDHEGDRCPDLESYRTLREGDRWPIPNSEMSALGVSVETVGGCSRCGAKKGAPHTHTCRR